MSLFQQAAGNSETTSKYLVEFNAGKCIVEGNVVKPDLRKGTIYMNQEDDQLLHLYWKERKTQASHEEDLIIFPDEAEFSRVSQCDTGRVYLLRFKSSNEHHFFWMQNKNDEKDQTIVERVTELIHDPNASPALDESASQAELMRLWRGVEGQDPSITRENLEQFLQSIGGNESGSAEHLEEEEEEDVPIQDAQVAPASTEANTEQTSTAAGGDSSEQLDRLREILANVNSGAAAGSSRAPISLNDVLTAQTLTPLLNDPEICSSLFPHLPEESERSVEEVRHIVKSPQFSQALASLSVALQTGQLGPLLSQLGLDYSAGNSVESFLIAISEQAKKKKKNDNNMDTTE